MASAAIAYEGVQDKLKDFAAELETWRDVSLAADYPVATR